MTETLDSAPSSTAEDTVAPVIPPETAAAPAQPQEGAAPAAKEAAEPATDRRAILANAGKKADGEAAPAADGQWQLKAPEGATFDPRVIAAYEKGAKAAGLDSEKAQALLDEVAPVMRAQTEARTRQLFDDWFDEIKADPAIAGADGSKLEQNLAAIKSVAEKFGGEALTDLLFGKDFSNPLGVNPAIAKFLLRVHKEISDDTVIPGRAAGASSDPLRAMYPNSPELFQ